MKFIAQKTEDGEIKGKLAMYCRVLNVSRQGFYNYLKNRNKPWKYRALADAMMDILAEDEVQLFVDARVGSGDPVAIQPAPLPLDDLESGI